MGNTTKSKIGLLFILNIWPLLIVSRTHYWIDLNTGLIVGHWACMMSEWISYPLDVKLMGFSSKDRNQHAYKPCEKCGYSNDDYSLGIHEDEKVFL